MHAREDLLSPESHKFALPCWPYGFRCASRQPLSPLSPGRHRYDRAMNAVILGPTTDIATCRHRWPHGGNEMITQHVTKFTTKSLNDMLLCPLFVCVMLVPSLGCVFVQATRECRSSSAWLLVFESDNIALKRSDGEGLDRYDATCAAGVVCAAVVKSRSVPRFLCRQPSKPN
jgi:hypothetical protein